MPGHRPPPGAALGGGTASSPAAPLPPLEGSLRGIPDPLHLLGSPCLPFSTRFNLTFAAASSLASWMLLGIVASILLRLPPGHAALTVSLGATACVNILDIAWARACRACHAGGSYARWRQAVVLPLLTICDVCNTHGLVVKAVFAQFGPGPPGPLGLARHAALLALASRLLTNLVVWGQCQRMSWALPAHLLMVSQFIRTNPIACATPALAEGPAAAQATRAVARALGTLQFGSLTPPLPIPLTASQECLVVLTYLQLTLCLVGPALVAALVETRMFLRHGEERRRCGLPPERGWQPWLGGLLLDMDWVFGGVLVWTLLGVLHLLALGLALNTLPLSPLPQTDP